MGELERVDDVMQKFVLMWNWRGTHYRKNNEWPHSSKTRMFSIELIKINQYLTKKVSQRMNHHHHVLNSHTALVPLHNLRVRMSCQLRNIRSTHSDVWRNFRMSSRSRLNGHRRESRQSRNKSATFRYFCVELEGDTMIELPGVTVAVYAAMLSESQWYSQVSCCSERQLLQYCIILQLIQHHGTTTTTTTTRS